MYEVLGSAGAVEVLETINKTGKTQYKDLSSMKVSISTLNVRLLQFLNFGFVEHFAIRNSKQRKEWYEITEKGRTVLEILIFHASGYVLCRVAIAVLGKIIFFN
ncbi:MAG: hypothetical protein AYK19_06400 [Theionarchaea archaeon DG-70-1]|nr:MAG: hypothetical protein AYK19_06400 [Theionarchaea archaeon DG-70-1]